MRFRTFSTYVTIVSLSLAASIGLLVILNWLAQSYLRSNPNLLMTAAERINAGTRVVRESLVSPERAVLWFDLESPDDVHAMWDERYNIAPVFESYVHFRSKPHIGLFYGVTEAGYRLSPKAGPWPPSPNKFNLFFFGGSTSFGVAPYWATVASYLEELMDRAQIVDRPVFAYNFGRSSYQSSQESILLHKLVSDGIRPDMVVFLDGLNDFCFFDGQPSSWQFLAHSYDRFHEEHVQRAAGYGIVTEWARIREFFETLPLARLIAGWQLAATQEPIPEYNVETSKAMEEPQEEVLLRREISRYVLNKLQVKAASAELGITPVFVWQPTPTYRYDTDYHVLILPDWTAT